MHCIALHCIELYCIALHCCTTKQESGALTVSCTAPSRPQWLYPSVNALLKKIEKLPRGERGRLEKSKGEDRNRGSDRDEKENECDQILRKKESRSVAMKTKMKMKFCMEEV